MSKGTFGKTASIYVVGNMLSKAVAFLLIPVFTKNLSSSQYGVLMSCTAFIGVLLPIISFEFRSAVKRIYVDIDEIGEKKKFVFSIFSVTVLSGFICLLVFESFGEIISLSIFNNISYIPFIRLAVIATVLKLVTRIPIAVLQIQEKAFIFSIIKYGSSIAKLVLSVFLVVYFERAVEGALEGVVLGNLVVLPFSLYVVYTNSLVAFSWSYVKEALSFSVPLIPHNLAHWFASLSDRIILENYAGPAEVGYYSLGYQLSQGIGFVATALATAIMPYMINRHMIDGADGHFEKITKYYFLLMSCIGMLVVVSGPYVVRIISDPEYYTASYLVYPVAIGYVLLSFYHIPRIYLTISKNTVLISIATIMSALFNVGLNFLLIPKYGARAAAWTTSLSYALLLIFILILSNQYSNNNIKVFETISILSIVLITSSAFQMCILYYGLSVWFLPLFISLIMFCVVFIYKFGYISYRESYQVFNN
ncbi:O-antigen/teichoic acid export membrane protein [Salinibacter ruber]|uniref:oligosaccharide flippase family protein n=1 Tax=Salinibacter ruber TaxID=146919 RepID=UPI0021676827|nr:oligosaccharide flippase family protein [Salinibacter ruber]MCS4193418.1 O-antigen/teichoic acid export membrane protein [Salinibacter ruber]